MPYIHCLPIQRSKEQLLKELNESSFSEKNKKFIAKKIEKGEIKNKFLDQLIQFNTFLQNNGREITKKDIERYLEVLKNSEEDVKKFKDAEYIDPETLHRPMTI